MTIKAKTATYILIADGFDELEVVACLHKFRSVGLWIKSISLYQSLVYSRQGVGLKADMCLAEMAPLNGKCLFILPAGGRNGDTLRHDARVKKLLLDLSLVKGKIAITNGNSQLAHDIHSQIMPPYQPQPNQTLDGFIQSLTNQIAFDFGD